MTSWRGTPSFFEATGGRMSLLTDVTPIRHRKIALEHEVALLPIDPREFRGVLLDEAVPAAITTGQTVTVSGTVTDTDADHNIACVRWLRFSSVTEPIDECGAIQHDLVLGSLHIHRRRCRHRTRTREDSRHQCHPARSVEPAGRTAGVVGMVFRGRRAVDPA